MRDQIGSFCCHGKIQLWPYWAYQKRSTMTPAVAEKNNLCLECVKQHTRGMVSEW
jgi:hypothetical protein